MARSFRRSTGRRSGGRQLRGMDWGGQTQSGTTGGTSPFYVFLPSVARSDYVDPTLMASRLKFNAIVPNTATGGAIGVGVIAWSDINDATPTDPPGPISHINLDWIIRQAFPIAPNSGSVIATTSLDLEYFSKARRRLGNDRGLLLVVENFGTGVVAGFAYDYRFLLKE